MSTVQASAFQRFLLYDVDWRSYSRFLRLFAERPAYRLTYDRGALEIMSPLPLHEREAYLLGRFIDVLTDELSLPVVAGRSTTFRRRRGRRGLEPDNSYWIANAARVIGLTKIDLRIHPPPDLAIEVDVSRSSLNRMAVYATLGVPEVWRFDDPQTLAFLVLQPNRTYAVQGTSVAFPLVTSADLLGFLRFAAQQDDTAIMGHFRAWVRSRLPGAPTTP